MFSIILAALTTVAVIHLSTNSSQLRQKAMTVKAMTQARDAVMSYALTQQTPQRPPGTLPCPDTTGDGWADPGAIGGCANRRGFLPFRDLGLDELLDGSGARLWYAVETNYTSPYGATPAAPFRNSSRPSNLTLFMRAANANQIMAFVIISPNTAFSTQNRTIAPLSAVTTFLEGINAGAGVAYDDLQDATHNDQFLGMPISLFWTNIEKLVLNEVKNTLNDYFTNCGVYPWATTFGSAGDNSTNNLYQGGVPLGLVSPIAWGSPCPAPPAPIVGKNAPSAPPNWLVDHWTQTLYYAICKAAAPATPSNPPTTSCLSLLGTTNSSARVIVMAPSYQITPPPARTSASPLTDFFEGENAITIGASNNIFDNIRPINHTNSANDLITVVAP